jgi:hypothetical protein
VEVGLLWAGPVSAATTCGASLGGFVALSAGADCAVDPIKRGQIFTLTYQLSNFSHQNAAPFAFVDGRLIAGSTIKATLACTDTTCAVAIPGTLGFLAVGANGCLSSCTAGTTCALDNTDPTGNTVKITIGPAGCFIAAQSTITVATVQVQGDTGIPNDATCGLFGARADSMPGAFTTEDTDCSRARS